MNRWPIREAFAHYALIARERAAAQYRHDCAMYALQAPYAKKGARLERPEVPEILR